MTRVLSEVQFGDYTLSHHPPEMGRESHAIVATHDGDQVGSMNWTAKRIEGIDVVPDHQRRGLATAMWEMGQDARPRAKHSAQRTDAGEAWSKAVGGSRPRRQN